MKNIITFSIENDVCPVGFALKTIEGKRVQYNEIPPRVEYSLTENGKKLLPVLNEFAKWGTELMELRK